MSIAATSRRILVATIAVLASSFAVLGATTTGADAASLSQIRSMSPDTYEARVIANINRVRAAHGLPKVRQQRCTDTFAERWSKRLGANLEFFHQSLDPILSRCKAVYAGETLARGAVTPAEMVQLWMDSPGHRAILLSKHPRRIGVGAFLDSRGDWLVAADFTRL